MLRTALLRRATGLLPVERAFTQQARVVAQGGGLIFSRAPTTTTSPLIFVNRPHGFHHHHLQFQISSLSTLTTNVDATELPLPAAEANAEEEQVERSRQRPWEDGRVPLQTRVALFVEDEIKPFDFVANETADLLIECCRRKNLQGMQWAHDIIERLLVEKRRLEKEDILVTIPVDLLQKVMYGWAVQADTLKVARIRMEELMRLIIQEAIVDQEAFAQAANGGGWQLGKGQMIPPRSLPTVDIFNTYLRGLSMSASNYGQAAFSAASLLDDMQALSKQYGWHTKPNTRSYTQVISAFGNCNREDSGENALRILRRMQYVHEKEAELYRQDYGVPYDEINPQLNKRRIVTADIVAYTATMASLSRSHNSGEKAMSLLQEILDSKTIKADARVFSVVIQAFGRVAELSKYPLQRIAAAQRAEEVLWSMVEYLHRTEEASALDEEAQGLLIACNSCLGAWSKCFARESAPKCEEILQKMMSGTPVKPDATSFNSCLFAWSKSHKFYPDAAERAEQLLELQHNLSHPSALGERVTPDFQSYTITILAHAYSDDDQKVFAARRLLESLMNRVKSGEIKMTRNVASPFSATITAAARSKSCVPGTTSQVLTDGFTSSVDTAENAFAIGERTFHDLRDDTFNIGSSPDHHAYGAFLKCIAKHTVPESSEREAKTRIVFEDACEAGEVSRLVMDGLTDTVGRTMLGIPELRSKELPKFWTRNVRGRFRYRKPTRESRGSSVH